MQNDDRTAKMGFGQFVLEAVGIAVLLSAVGWFPTQRVVGPDGIEAMAAGILVSLFASVVGAVPATMSRGRPASAAQSIMGACMALRLALVAGGGLAVALAGWFERNPLLIWLAISYAVLLVVDTRFLVATFGSRQSANNNS